MNSKIYYKILLCAGLFCTSLAHAYEFTVNAVYKPDATQPYLREFKDTTPTGGFCIRFATVCKEKKINSTEIAIFSLMSKNMDSSKSDPESILAVRFDNMPRTVVLRERNTGKIITAEFALTMLGQFIVGDAVNGEGSLESLTKNTPVGGCTEWIYARNNWEIESYLLPHTTGNAFCTKPFDPRYDSWKGQVFTDSINVTYSLKVSSPLEAESGIYEGEVLYTFGNGKDIDFFGGGEYDDNFNIKIIATVEHAFYLRFPSGSEKVVLDAKGGWSQWVNGGTVPQSLSQDIPFRLSSSRPFKIQMRCELNSGAGCGLKNQRSQKTVPLSVKLSMPGFTHNGQPVKNTELEQNGTGSLIENDRYIVNQLSHLHFSVDNSGVQEMVKEPGSDWKGDVTLIFDADF
ncbi:hypothetical protein [Enterobacter bugandensis]|uniref:hypothetical protein n=1 Tax=Enterobacter bugandensis TaxID=881260 RepID=UPI002FD2EDF6